MESIKAENMGVGKWLQGLYLLQFLVQNA